MRRYSLFTIILLCFAILIVDILSYYWLQRITKLHASTDLKLVIDILFWFFTIGLMSAIIILKIRMDSISALRRQRLISSLYGLAVASFAPKLIFVIVFSILTAINYVFSEEASIIVVPIIGLLSGIIPFVMIVYAIFVSLYRFRLNNVNLIFENLPENFDGVRIVQISDLHLGSFNRRYHILERAFDKINDLNPDYIFFTGDLVNNYAWELEGWESLFLKLKANRGKFSVFGNHDYGDYSEWPSEEAKEENLNGIKNFYQATNFKLLLNETHLDRIGDDQIALIGVENWGNPPFKQYGDLEKAARAAQFAPFRILLSHDPTHWAEEVAGKVDIALTLSGHTHGMQAGIRYRNKQWSPAKLKYKHWAGLYEEKGQYLYVNRGMGWMGFPGRIGMRPEVTLFKLKTVLKNEEAELSILDGYPLAEQAPGVA
ncbi:MAG: metallophosphoesterase [Flavobacteriaceae bacterium]|nr:metallophosphoesterase [Flavobacteriaceae bacterium]NNM08593.1 metallophosphoesterase [Flavobacteriaceae bacterium]